MTLRPWRELSSTPGRHQRLLYQRTLEHHTWPCASAMLDLMGLNRMACVAGLARYKRMRATAAGSGPRSAARTFAAISASRSGAAKACSASQDRVRVRVGWHSGDMRPFMSGGLPPPYLRLQQHARQRSNARFPN